MGSTHLHWAAKSAPRLPALPRKIGNIALSGFEVVEGLLSPAAVGAASAVAGAAAAWAMNGVAMEDGHRRGRA